MQNERATWQTNLCVMLLLIGFGLVGRWLQPDWNFTPVAAVSLFAGYFFRSAGLAAAVPLLVVALSNVILPAYNSFGELVSVHLAFLAPVALGRLLHHRYSHLRLAASAPAAALTFYLITNFAVWAFNDWYPPTATGLGECYVQALPFLRKMLAGDVFYTTAVFGAYALATAWRPASARAV